MNLRRESGILLLLFVHCTLPPHLATAAASLRDVYTASLPALLKGVKGSYPRSAYASPYVIWAPTGFPIALGADNTTPLPVVAAVQLASTSRLVAFGHEGIISGCCSKGDAWDRLAVNAFRWLADAKQANRSYIRLAAPTVAAWSIPGTALTSIGQLLSSLSSYPLTVSGGAIDLDVFAAGAPWTDIDIMWIDSYIDYTPDQVAAFLEFMNLPGKGLMVAGHAWNWGASHPDANIYTDLPVNKILFPLGLVLTTDYQYGFQPAPSTPPASWPYHNALYDATILAAANNGGAKFTNTSYYPTVNTALQLLLRTLPPRAKSSISGLDSVWSRVEKARSGASSAAVGPATPLAARTGYPGDVLDVAIDAWSIRRSDITGLKPSRSAAAYPGVPPANTPTVNFSLTINGTYNVTLPHAGYGDIGAPVWRSTGVYAPPGQVITVTIKTKAAINKGLRVQIGAHTDDLTWKELWARIPNAVSTFPLDAAVTSAGNPLGGLVFILVPWGSRLGKVQITVSGVVRAPYYIHGTTSKSSWTNTVRKYPAPWAELDTGKLVIMVPSRAIRDLTDLSPLMKHWNLVMDSMAYIANMQPAARPRAERFLVDADISAGWMHSGYPIMAYDDPGVLQELLDVTRLKAQGAWGPYHELGHNHQWNEMMFSGTTESSTNLFTVYALEQTGVPQSSENWNNISPAVRAKARAEYLARGAKWAQEWDVWIALDTYLQLKEGFGWSFYRRMYEAYQQMALPLPDDNVQIWIATSSRVAGVNLIPFYTKWGFPISERTRNLVASLPAWLADPMQ